MASALVRELIDAGVHFGHRVSRWNPKMAPYIFSKRNSIHIIDIRETVRGLLRARKFVSAIVAKGQDILIVGTKRQARDIVEKQTQRVGMHYVSERWLGGTLTNFKTIRSRLARLEELEEMDRSGRINECTKKERATIDREKRKITRNLEGIRRMTRLPGALVILDVKREHIAVKEAKKLGIPTVCLVDTDSDPESADVIIPANDDAMRAIEIVVTQLCDAVEEGKRSRAGAAEAAAEQTDGGAPRPKRPRRKTTTALAEEAAGQGEMSDDVAEPMAMPLEELGSPISDSTPKAEVTDHV
ncbi:MAG TPA: 30S ribosomal protein S2 [Phycisphaerae bacterium]|nr:30S ribosomal protein S2 [Phycisphaerae bacterium]